MKDSDDIFLIYDRQCPACELYCTLTRVRESAGRLVLVDARDGGPLLDEITAAGLDIDDGMVLKVGGRLYYGADAIHALSLMGTGSDAFNRVSYWAFRSQRVARVLYPALRLCRNLLLKLLGRTRINNLGRPGRDRF